MITASHSQLMAQYNEWMNSRMYVLCASIPDAELHRDRGAFFRSIYASLNHIAYGDLAFLSRFTGTPSVVPEPGADLFGTFSLLRAERATLDKRILAWSESLSPARLAQPLASPGPFQSGCVSRTCSITRRTIEVRSPHSFPKWVWMLALPTFRLCRSSRPMPNPALNRTGRYAASFWWASARPAG
jgi:hypothetical protein